MINLCNMKLTLSTLDILKYFVILIITPHAINCRQLGSKCKEELDWFNKLVLERVEESEFSVEPVLGVGVPAKPKLDATMEELVQTIKEQNDTLSPWRIRECLGRYLKGSRPWNPNLAQGNGDPGQLGYEKPHYLGPIEPFPIPVPDDEDYKPGPEGYTTYINPYNFMDKVPEYKPRPKPSSDDYDDYLDSSEETDGTTSTSSPSPDDKGPEPDNPSPGPGKPGLPDRPDNTTTTTSTTTTKKPSTDSDYEDDYNYSDDDDYY